LIRSRLGEGDYGLKFAAKTFYAYFNGLDLIGVKTAHQEGKKYFQQIDKNRINLDIFVAVDFFRTVTEMQFHN
jgi:hypothetical protein